jgi:uncharacterized membrane protein
MQTSARTGRYGVHPVLIIIPLGLFGISVVFDIVGMLSTAAIWALASGWNIAAGVATGTGTACAFARGHIVTHPGTRGHHLSRVHFLLWCSVIALFASSLTLRVASSQHVPPAGAISLSVIGLIAGIVAGWFGEAIVRRAAVHRPVLY